MKKIISFILTISICIGLIVHMQVVSANSNVLDDTSYATPEVSSQYSVYYGEDGEKLVYYIEGETINIVEWSGNNDTITIPDRIGDQKITKVSLEEAVIVKHMVLGDGIEEIHIRDNAWNDFRELRTITLGKNFASDGLNCCAVYAFGDLNKIYVSENSETLKSIQGVLFSKDGKKIMLYPKNRGGKYKVPKGTRTINDYAFYGATKLKKIVMPSSIKTIGDYSYDSCTSIKKVVIPSGVKKIGEHAFSGCHSLTDVVIPSSVKKIGDFSFDRCKSLTKVVLPSGIKMIGTCAFDGCENLKKVIIPKSVKKIGGHSFLSCKSLNETVIRGKKTKIELQAIGFNSKNYIKYTINKKTVIVAPKGSRAQKYAKKNGLKFRALGGN